MKYLFFLFSLLCFSSSAQVGINTDNPQSALDIKSPDDGILIPRIALVDLTTPVINTPEISELVYNTTDNLDLDPGFYYWNRTQWKQLIDVFQTLEINGDQLSISHGNDITLPPIDADVETRIIPLFNNGWTPFGGGSSTPTYYKDRDRVYLAGSFAVGPTPDNVIFTLPVGYRPSETFSFPLGVPSGFVNPRIYVYTDGRVFVNTTDYSFLSLDHISFRID